MQNSALNPILLLQQRIIPPSPLPRHRNRWRRWRGQPTLPQVLAHHPQPRRQQLPLLIPTLLLARLRFHSFLCLLSVRTDRRLRNQLPGEPSRLFLVAVAFGHPNVERLHHFEVLLYTVLGCPLLVQTGFVCCWGFFFLRLGGGGGGYGGCAGAVVPGEQWHDRYFFYLELHREQLALLMRVRVSLAQINFPRG